MKKYQLKLKADRVATFSDGVFAIIITLMILNIHVPHLGEIVSSKEIWKSLFSLLPSLIAYGVSFFSLAIFWMNHHNFFHMLKHIDSTLLWINMILLFVLSLIPLPTTFISEQFDKPEATLIYGFVMFVCNLVFGIMYYYAMIWDLLIENVNKQRLKLIAKQIIWSCSLWIFSMFIGYISVYLSYATYLIIMLIFVYPQNIELVEGENNWF
jgi:uncharacterized membrane protein